MTLDIDPNSLIHPRSYGAAGQPHEAWTQLRAQAPVWLCEPDNYPSFYAITRHADITDISGRPEVFSNSDGIAFLSLRQLEERKTGPSPLAQMRTIIEMDPPEHRDFRKVASGFFTPRSIGRLDAVVNECARQHVDKLGEEGECDFVELIAERHPLRVLATILGIGPDDEDLLLRLTQQLLASDDPDLQRKAENREQALAELGADLLKLFNRVLEDRRARPRDDLATIIAHAQMADGTPMPMLETLGYYLIVFTAGHDTTRNAISGGMAAFLEHPDQLARLGAAPELARPAVEEIVRWSSPVNYMKRRLREDVEMRGVRMREGEDLVMFYASANRDETVFERPFEFDISRHPNRHIGFGSGEHFCLGAHVARLSTRALFRELATRIEWIEPAGEAALTESNLVVGHKALPIRYKLRPAA
ncbi:MAG: cytochrome P450 [Proteobacteria bacterium]|nr:cytochrome P450 [Pseudomonadota bacterium]